MQNQRERGGPGRAQEYIQSQTPLLSSLLLPDTPLSSIPQRPFSVSIQKLRETTVDLTGKQPKAFVHTGFIFTNLSRRKKVGVGRGRKGGSGLWKDQGTVIAGSSGFGAEELMLHKASQIRSPVENVAHRWVLITSLSHLVASYFS